MSAPNVHTGEKLCNSRVNTYLIAQLYSAGQLDGVMLLLESVVDGSCLAETCGESAGAN
jgi:hypothetical protein